MNQQHEEPTNVEAGTTFIREIVAMGIGLLLVYWGKVEGPYLMTFIAYVIAAHYPKPRDMRKGAVRSALGSMGQSLMPPRGSLFSPPVKIDDGRDKE